MRIVQIEIEAEDGMAVVISRKGNTIEVRNARRRRNGEYTVLMNVDAGSQESIRYAATKLQKNMDGHEGAQGDVAGYERVLQMFAD